MDPRAADQLRRLGIDPSGFRARSLTPVLAERADLILTATTTHRSDVLQLMPRALRRTFSILEFVHLACAVEGVRDAAGSPWKVVRLAAALSRRKAAWNCSEHVLGPRS